ncbi:Soluble starch synthase 3, chloroplastic/amyloplastic [Apostasia shenzhenica]|uniref:starch synthase n=1 Tax=Apostasia shenzhenica TaxID=1088818 RepID=A0A2I0AD98_9ASPA|nr:Soluble starch synthase 3, chloroplastic/amyloplastic [Apostasia shenzhenica]
MEIAMHLLRPVGCKAQATDLSRFRIRPTNETFTVTLLLLLLLTMNMFIFSICAFKFVFFKKESWVFVLQDYSRKRQRRSVIPNTKVTTPKGFAPRPQVGTSTQKKDHNPERKEQTSSSQSSSSKPSTSQFSKLIKDGEGKSDFDSLSNLSSTEIKSKFVLEAEEESVKDSDKLVEDPSVCEDVEGEVGMIMQERELGKDDKDCEKGSIMNHGNLKIEKITDYLGKFGIRSGNVKGKIGKWNTEYHSVASINMEDEGANVDASTRKHATKINFKEQSYANPDSEMDAHARWKLLEDLAEESFSCGNKVFVFPRVVKADQVIEVFFNRSLSPLVNEPDVLIKGSFNDWRWKRFTEKMSKSDLKGNWWSSMVYVPKEAYKIDFVFFNGGQVYENNNGEDFSAPVESDMNESSFEDLLLEEERKRLEMLAAEQAEKQRQEEEQRRREEEQAAREADRALAKLEVEKKRGAFQRVMRSAAKSVDGLWHIEPALFKGRDRVQVYYNQSSRPLEHAVNIWIHGGYNNWIDGLSIVERLKRSDKKDGNWWYANVEIATAADATSRRDVSFVDKRALVLDWVFADGPPQQAKVYDNNGYQDFHAAVTDGLSEEIYWVEEENRVFSKLQEDRKLKEEASRKKAEKTARMKAETKGKALKRFLLSQKHVVFTDPVDIRSGMTVKVMYNPYNTVLNGKPEVWFRCSFNRWTHSNGPLKPQKMDPVGNGTQHQAIVKVPLDAYTMDFVFSEREDGGIYDNKNGMDYHIPVMGGIVKEPPLHIMHVAVEMAPIAKVGGLGDVVTSLSRAVQDFGHTIDIILPKMFCVGCVYGRNDDGDRFGFFCHAALEFILHSGFRPDILHCHDWSSAPVAWLFKENYMHYGIGNARVIFTIHNLEFGIGQIARAMVYADRATTVSNTYSKEVSGNPAISPHLYKFHGILNGIDPDIWDPYDDNFIPVSYTSENVVEGKKAAKESLQQRLGLRKSDHPLLGIVTRLTVQKGIHLIKHAIRRTLDCNGQVVLLGSAPDPRIQNDFVNLANQLHQSHGDRVRLCLTYDEPLSHLIYAGSDFILVPSIFEPCGLTQLIAMRYGSIPIVRKTGVSAMTKVKIWTPILGLYDTVFDVDDDKERAQSEGLEPNGFNFEGADSAGVDYALNRAISAWYDGREWFNLLCKRVMQQDWSWNKPALDYIEVYHAARK